MKTLFLKLLWTLCLLGSLGLATAQAPAEVDQTLDEARARVEQIRKRLGQELGDAELAGLRRDLLALQQKAQAIEREQQPQFDSTQARLTELGEAPSGAEAADVAVQRRSLKSSSEKLDARLKLARLLALESEQLAEEFGAQRQAHFRAQLFERTDSMLSPAFWQELREGLDRDAARLQDFGQRLLEAAARGTPQRWLLLAGLLLVALGLRVWLARRLTDWASHRVPQGRVRRSLFAVARALLAMLLPGLIAYALALGLSQDMPADDPLARLLANGIGALCFAAFIAGLGRALLSSSRPSWRLLPLPDLVAQGLRWYPLYLAILSFANWLTLRLAGMVPLSLAIEVALNGAYALLLGLLLARMVHRGEQLRRQAAATAAQDQGVGGLSARPTWLSLALVGVWGLLVCSILGIVMGYVALGSFVVRQVTWVGVLLLSTYLLNLLIDDCFNTWLGSGKPAEAQAAHAPSQGRVLRDQALVLSSGALRLTLWLLALVLILAPFGEGPVDLLRRTDQLRVGIAVGELQLRPTAVLQALLVFLFALLALRVLKRWFSERFLPTTALDAGMRSSVSTLLGFLGTVVAIGLGLSAVGLALDRVAWIASALSVGIGFGLQAVVSNFVSGLILLAERPVKVGDWVTLGGPGGGIEGDIRRINVRATEIQMSDRSTLIVPNSEFITKVVRNVTHESPIGLVQIKLPMPLDTDATRVREILLEVLRGHEEVLESPAPNVQLDGIDGASLLFNASGYVASPRQSYGVRSALLFKALAALHEAGLPPGRAPNLLLRERPADPA